MVERKIAAATVRDGQVYGWCAFVLGAFLIWYAAWTVECNVLVLTGRHYGWFLWAPLPPSLLVLAGWPLRHRIVAEYALMPAGGATEQRSSAAVPLGPREWAVLAGALLVAAVAAHLGYHTLSPIPYVAATLLVALALAASRGPLGRALRPLPPIAIGWRLPALVLVLFAIYYFAHRIDGDDANFVNMAIGAQRTHGAVYQYDTMLGDGPNLIHLPTYKFHSFELLGAVLSSYTGLEPIAVLHLLIPAIELPLLAIVLLTTLAPAAGRYWLAATLFWLAFLFANELALGGWGLHGVIRFYQGKGFLVSALLPLTAALAFRWFRLGRKLDLAALFLAGICAIGFSANGLYGGPAASGLVAAAVIAADFRSARMWRRALLLLLTFAYSAIAAGLITWLHLALPSEQLTPTLAVDQLDFAVHYGVLGRATLAVLALSGLGLFTSVATAPALVYVPLAMLLTLNPLSWHVISAISGNLGFRIFWSLPVASLVALTGVAVLRLATVRSEWLMLAAGALAILGAVRFLDANASPVTTVRWHRPDLKVIRPDYELAQRLARRTDPNCRILAPETYAMLLSMIRGAPHPVFVRSLYLVHYRFTLPPAERALRERLRMVVDGPAAVTPPPVSEIAAVHVPIGTVAVRADAPSRPAAETLARNLDLAGPDRDGPLLIWTGRCHG